MCPTKIHLFSWKDVGCWGCCHVPHHIHWGRVTYICVTNLTIIDSDNGLSPGRHQAIIWTHGGILLIGPLGTNFSKILIEIKNFSLMKCIWKCHIFCWMLNQMMIHWWNPNINFVFKRLSSVKLYFTEGNLLKTKFNPTNMGFTVIRCLCD